MGFNHGVFTIQIHFHFSSVPNSFMMSVGALAPMVVISTAFMKSVGALIRVGAHSTAFYGILWYTYLRRGDDFNRLHDTRFWVHSVIVSIALMKRVGSQAYPVTFTWISRSFAVLPRARASARPSKLPHAPHTSNCPRISANGCTLNAFTPPLEPMA